MISLLEGVNSAAIHKNFDHIFSLVANYHLATFVTAEWETIVIPMCDVINNVCRYCIIINK